MTNSQKAFFISLIIFIGLFAESNSTHAYDEIALRAGYPHKASVVVVGSQWYGHIPVWVGIERGIFSDHGFNVSWRFVYSSSDRISAISKGEAQFASAGEFAMLQAMSEQGEQRFYWVGSQDNAPGFEGLISYENSINDLQGKKIGLPIGSSVEITCRLLLRLHGLEPDKDVQLVDLKATDVVAAFRSRKVDAAMIWEPNFSKLASIPGVSVLATDKRVTETGQEVETYKRFGTSSGPDVLLISKDWVDADTQRAKRFLKAYFSALQWSDEHPEEAVKIVHGKYIQQDVEQLKQNLKNIKWLRLEDQRKIMSDSGIYKHVEFISDFLHKEKRLSAKPDFRRWINLDILSTQDN